MYPGILTPLAHRSILHGAAPRRQCYRRWTGLHRRLPALGGWLLIQDGDQREKPRAGTMVGCSFRRGFCGQQMVWSTCCRLYNGWWYTWSGMVGSNADLNL